MGGVQPRCGPPQNRCRGVRLSHHHRKMVAVCADHVLTGRQQPPEFCWDSTKATPSTVPSSSTCPAPPAATTTPAWSAAGAPGYGKSYAAKRLVQRRNPARRPAFIVDPDIAEWAHALADIPDKAIIDMGGDEFGVLPAAHLPRESRRRILAGLHGAHDGPGLAQHRRATLAPPASPRPHAADSASPAPRR